MTLRGIHSAPASDRRRPGGGGARRPSPSLTIAPAWRHAGSARGLPRLPNVRRLAGVISAPAHLLTPTSKAGGIGPRYWIIDGDGSPPTSPSSSDSVRSGRGHPSRRSSEVRLTRRACGRDPRPDLRGPLREFRWHFAPITTPPSSRSRTTTRRPRDQPEAETRPPSPALSALLAAPRSSRSPRTGGSRWRGATSCSCAARRCCTAGWPGLPRGAARSARGRTVPEDATARVTELGRAARELPSL